MKDINADKCLVSFAWLCLRDLPENLVQNLCKKVTRRLHVFNAGIVYCCGILSLPFLCRDFKVMLSTRADIPRHRAAVVMPNAVFCSLHIYIFQAHVWSTCVRVRRVAQLEFLMK